MQVPCGDSAPFNETLKLCLDMNSRKRLENEFLSLPFTYEGSHFPNSSNISVISAGKNTFLFFYSTSEPASALITRRFRILSSFQVYIFAVIFQIQDTRDTFLLVPHTCTHTTCKWGEICPLLLTHPCEHSGAQHTVNTQ